MIQEESRRVGCRMMDDTIRYGGTKSDATVNNKLR